MTKFCCLILALLFWPSTASATPSDIEDVFSRVPPQHRAVLLKKVSLYIAYERRMDYGGLYELLAERTKRPEYLKAGDKYPLLTKVSYVRYRQSVYPKFLSFTPVSATKLGGGGYEIRGYAKVRYRSGTVQEERILYAWLEDDTWVFSELNSEIVH